jgi:hypothetical protein
MKDGLIFDGNIFLGLLLCQILFHFTVWIQLATNQWWALGFEESVEFCCKAIAVRVFFKYIPFYLLFHDIEIITSIYVKFNTNLLHDAFIC